ncbi:hypothetical protein HK100_003248 [Physocladia obscura]|uniref:Uncharacterized protein n=1 Tax=Physocladia obscura TaxID=109957 RepID=A0AAD5XLB2_9FUNG|nr:hypothetical protein HK100_003248 [Physocladia obscura]
MMVISSDSGSLAFVILTSDSLELSRTDIVVESDRISPQRFELVYEIRIAPPGIDYNIPGQKVAVDPL